LSSFRTALTEFGRRADVLVADDAKRLAEIVDTMTSVANNVSIPFIEAMMAFLRSGCSAHGGVARRDPMVKAKAWPADRI
jgi:hypothetical protein